MDHPLTRLSTLVAFASIIGLAASSRVQAADPDTPDPYLDEILEQAALDAQLYESIYLASPLAAPERPLVPREDTAVIFLNFDGEQLQGSQGYVDDSKTNTSWVLGAYAGAGAYPYEAYDGSEQQKQAIIDATREDFAPFDITIVTERPTTGDYTMAMVGPSNFIGGSVLGVAPVDCGDQIRNNVVFAFNGASHQIVTAATTIGQEVAHSYGLEHVTNNADILYPTTGGAGDPTFVDSCSSITGQQLMCGSQHAAQCGSQNQQNSFAELLAIFGQSAPDTADPTVNITSPSDGTVYEPGDAFTLTVDAADDVGVTVVDLYVDGQLHSGIDTPPYAWPVVGIPEGEHEFYAVAKDAANNESISPVVTVYASADGEIPGGDPDGDGEGTGAPGDGFPPGFGDDDEDSEAGCGCATDTAPGRGATALALFALLPWLRRRR